MIVDFFGMGMGFGDGNDNENGDSYNQIVDCHVSERDGWLVGGGGGDGVIMGFYLGGVCC